jgi:hypothetical protein
MQQDDLGRNGVRAHFHLDDASNASLDAIQAFYRATFRHSASRSTIVRRAIACLEKELQKLPVTSQRRLMSEGLQLVLAKQARPAPDSN